MHLSYSESKYKGKTYRSYAVAESYREGKRVKKRILWKIGKLTDEQAERIRMICRAAKSEDQFADQLKNIVVKETRSYLDIAVVNELWNYWELDKAFANDCTDSALPTHLVAKILAINRCVDPRSHYSVPKWAKKNALQEVLGVELTGLNDDKIYYELDKIHWNQSDIEDHIFERTHSMVPESYDFVNYDLTTSYFVGHRCELSAFGKGKVECHGRKQVVLGVLINSQGYPFKWDVFPGNTAEVKTLKQNIEACRTRFRLGGRGVTLVFDRGIISEENADEIGQAKIKYISALDKSQISSCGIDLDPFEDYDLIDVEEAGVEIGVPRGFKTYDEDLYIKDAGVIGGKRLVVGFNPGLFSDERNLRDLKLGLFEEYLRTENNSLKNAKKDRNADATRNRVVSELKRLKIGKYFEAPVLHEIRVEKTLKDGTIRTVRSFQVTIEAKTDVIAAEKLIDGVCVFVTNHVERKGRGYRLNANAIVNAYRNKGIIEDVFKNLKSFLKLRPFFVNTDRHVRAVYTICMISYFINRHLANQRMALGEKDYLNSRELYAPFRDKDIAVLEDVQTGRTVSKGVRLPEETLNLLKMLKMAHIVFGEQ